MNLFVIQTQRESLHLDVDLMEPIESKTSVDESTYLLPAYIKGTTKRNDFVHRLVNT